MILLLAACSDEVFRVSRPQMGTIITITAICDRTTASRATERAFDEIARIENLMSPYRPGSDVYRINNAAGPVALNPETFNLIGLSLEISARTHGAFDCSFAALAPLWDYKKKDFVPPSKKDIDRLLGLVHYKNIILNGDDRTITLRHGMKLGLGGIAKGYAVKRAVEILKSEGVRAGIVEEGGDLQVFGAKPGGPWLTGLRHPRKNLLLLSIELEDGDSIATSGDYERFVEHRGTRYHHILDPRTGHPARGMASVSVLSGDPVASDAYATAFFVMGAAATINFLKTNPESGLKVILIDSGMGMFISAGLKERIQFLEQPHSVAWIRH
jgi:thiamine biosynthesis lipoprotein